MHILRPPEQKFHEEIEQRLLARLRALDTALQQHKARSSERLPADSEDASSMREQMDIANSEENADIVHIRETIDALERIQNGTYGICASCHEPISKERLRAVPEARYCLNCRARFEKDPSADEWPY